MVDRNPTGATQRSRDQDTKVLLSRRAVLAGGSAIAAVAAVTACTGIEGGLAADEGPLVRASAGSTQAPAIGPMIVNQTGSTQSNTHVRFQTFFAKGDVPPARLIKVYGADGVEIPSQNALQTYWSDGSVRTACIIVRCPSIPSSGLRIKLDNARGTQSDAPGATIEAVAGHLNDNGDVHWRFTVDGRSYTASVRSAFSDNRSKAGGHGFDWNRSWIFGTWISGPLCTCYRVFVAPRTSDGTPHPHLRCFYDVYLYLNGSGAIEDIEVDCILHNGTLYEYQNGLYLLDDASIVVRGAAAWSRAGRHPNATLTPQEVFGSNHMRAVPHRASAAVFRDADLGRYIRTPSTIVYIASRDSGDEIGGAIAGGTQAYSVVDDYPASGSPLALYESGATGGGKMFPRMTGHGTLRFECTACSAGATVTIQGVDLNFEPQSDEVVPLVPGGIAYSTKSWGYCTAFITGTAKELRAGHGRHRDTGAIAPGDWKIMAMHLHPWTRFARKVRYSTRAVATLDNFVRWGSGPADDLMNTKVVPKWNFAAIGADNLDAALNDRLADLAAFGKPGMPASDNDPYDINPAPRSAGKLWGQVTAERADAETWIMPDYDVLHLYYQSATTWKVMLANSESAEAWRHWLWDAKTGKPIRYDDPDRTNRGDTRTTSGTWSFSDPDSSTRCFMWPTDGITLGINYHWEHDNAHAQLKAQLAYLMTGDARWWDCIANHTAFLWLSVHSRRPGPGTDRAFDNSQGRDFGATATTMANVLAFRPNGVDADVLLPESMYRAHWDRQVANFGPGFTRGPANDGSYPYQNAPAGEAYKNKGDYIFWDPSDFNATEPEKNYNNTQQYKLLWGLGRMLELGLLDNDPMALDLVKALGGVVLGWAGQTHDDMPLVMTTIYRCGKYEQPGVDDNPGWPIQVNGLTGIRAMYDWQRARGYPDTFTSQKLYGYTTPSTTLSAPGATTTGSGKVWTTSDPVFFDNHQDSGIAYDGGRATITEVNGPSEVVVTVDTAFSTTSLPADGWKLQFPKRDPAKRTLCLGGDRRGGHMSFALTCECFAALSFLCSHPEIGTDARAAFDLYEQATINTRGSGAYLTGKPGYKIMALTLWANVLYGLARR